MKTITKICQYCEKEFQAPLAEHKRGNAKYCTRSCSSKHAHNLGLCNSKRIQEPNVTCAFCGKDFYKRPSHFQNSKSGLFFCTRSCKDQAQRIGGLKAIQPPHYNNGKSHYRVIAFRSYPHSCADCGYDSIPNILVVHHLDRDHSNNDSSNLVILCPNCHETRHFKDHTGRYQGIS